MFCIPRHADYFKRPRIFVTNLFRALNLPIISQSVCQCLKIMLQPNIDEHTRATQIGSFTPTYPQTLGSGERSCKLQTLQLITGKCFCINLWIFCKKHFSKFIGFMLGVDVIKLFSPYLTVRTKKLVRLSLPAKFFSAQSNIYDYGMVRMGMLV